MRVIDLINSNEKTAFSFEILPPLKGTGIEKLYQTIDTLREFDPKYINITTHRSEYVYKDLGNGLFQRNRLRRRPGTVAVAAAIQNKYNITMVPHILCSGFTREETEYVLLDLQFLGITDLLVLRGDKAKHESSFIPVGNGYHHAVELQEQINNFNKGIFVDGSEMKVTNTPFSYGVACYPEKHEEAPNMDTDIYWLKAATHFHHAVELQSRYFCGRLRIFHTVWRAIRKSMKKPPTWIRQGCTRQSTNLRLSP